MDQFVTLWATLESQFLSLVMFQNGGIFLSLTLNFYQSILVSVHTVCSCVIISLIHFRCYSQTKKLMRCFSLPSASSLNAAPMSPVLEAVSTLTQSTHFLNL